MPGYLWGEQWTNNVQSCALTSKMLMGVTVSKWNLSPCKCIYRQLFCTAVHLQLL